MEVVYRRPKAGTATKGLFGRRISTKPSDMEETVLGSAALELKDLLETNFVAVDVPLVESRRELGGTLRVAIRSGRPFGIQPDKDDGDAAHTGVAPTIPLQGYPHFLLPDK